MLGIGGRGGLFAYAVGAPLGYCQYPSGAYLANCSVPPETSATAGPPRSLAG
jgi:hypothetical protein